MRHNREEVIQRTIQIIRECFLFSLLVSFFLTACAPGTSDFLSTPPFEHTATTLPHSTTPTSLPVTPTSALALPSLTPTFPPPSPTSTPVPLGFPVQPGSSLLSNGSLIAYEVQRADTSILMLADPAMGISYEFNLPSNARYATPFLAGLSPDNHYFVYFTGGWIEELYGVEHLRASAPDLVLHVLDLASGELIFSANLLSPSFPNDLAPIAEAIQDDWWFTSANAAFEDVVGATQEFLLDHLRKVAWSPDSSLLAFASQDPGPSSDLYLFNSQNGVATRVSTEPGHLFKVVWAPDSFTLMLETSFYDRHARDDTYGLITRDGTLLTSFTSQVYYFHHWHDASHAIVYGGTDSGDLFDLKVISAVDGTTSLLWDGSYGDIALSPDLSTFLSSSNIPSAPIPPHRGLYLGRFEDDVLLTLSENWGWGVTYWGSATFEFAASSLDEGTIGVTALGERITLADGYWDLVASPDGLYLAGYNGYNPSHPPGRMPGLRIFDQRGTLIEVIDEISVSCVSWNTASITLAYQVESSLYLWDSLIGSTRLVSDQLNPADCSFEWVRESP